MGDRASAGRVAGDAGRDAPGSEPAADPDGGHPAAGSGVSSRPAVDRRRIVVLTTLGVLLALVVGAALIVARGDQPPPPKPDIPLDAWAPYWALDASLPEFDRRSPALRDVSPFWFNAVGADQIVADPNASSELTAQFIDEARRSDVNVVPSIIDAMGPGEMAAILADPQTRGRHVDTIVAFAADGDYDGIDIDYEQFAFADGKRTWTTTRPNWVAFIEELADGLHGVGKSLTVSIPPVYDDGRTSESGFWVYDYGAVSEFVDRIRIMAYDFSVAEPGPIAPLHWVESAIEGAIEATGSPDKLVLGLPAYGRNWPVFVSGECPATDVPGRTSVSARSVDELIQRRNAVPVRSDSTGEWMFEYQLDVSDGTTTCTQTRQVYYVDGDGIRQRMDLAREHRLNGVSLWALGFDDDAVWTAMMPTVADAHPTSSSSTTG